jgi:hypothetical protein
MKTRFLLLFATAASLIAAPLFASRSDDMLVTAVFSRVHNGYEREKAADGAFKRETYLVANGGYDAGVAKDASIDDVQFAGIVRVMAPYLAKQNYVPAPRDKSADLMLVIYWGKTVPFEDARSGNAMQQAMFAFKDAQASGQGLGRSPGFFSGRAFGMSDSGGTELESAIMGMEITESARYRADAHNANLLGYTHEIDLRDNPGRYAGAGTAYDDLMADLEEERYYVVIGAYDFQEMLKKKDKKLVWSTRVSIRARGERFDERLVAMMANASRYFGAESGRLVRQYQRAPRVDLGELKALGVVSDQTLEKK